MEIKGRTFANGEQIDVDGKRFTDCRFDKATLRYSGGPHPLFTDCNFSGAAWLFAGAALRSIQLLQQINAAPGGPDFIAGLFAEGKIFADE